MNDDWLWKTRCPDSGYLVGECSCDYCFQEFEMDEVDEYDDIWDWNDDSLEWLDEDDDEFGFDEWEVGSL